MVDKSAINQRRFRNTSKDFGAQCLDMEKTITVSGISTRILHTNFP